MVVAYNTDNMPIQITRGSLTVGFTYDGAGRRVKKTVSGGSTTLYIGEHYEVKDGVVTKYIFGGNLRLAVVKGANTYYYHKDHLGSTGATTDVNGNQVEGANYLPFGSMREHTGDHVSDYKFTDQELDNETNLYNYNARLYDPILGMFVTPDSIVQYPFDPQFLNRYSYCRNNPLIYIDPSGYGVTDPEGKGMSGMSGPSQSDDGPTFEISLIQYADVPKRSSGTSPGAGGSGGSTSPGGGGTSPIGGGTSPGGGGTSPIGGGTSIGAGPPSGPSTPGDEQPEETSPFGIPSIFESTSHGLGAGFHESPNSSFRLSNGFANGRQFSPQYYKSGWGGGSRAIITTYSCRTAGNVLGYGAIGFGVIMAGVEVKHGWDEDGGKWGYNANVATGRAVGTLAGVWAGAKVGAALGAVIGAPFAGIGTFPGVVIGAIAGGVFGGFTVGYLGGQVGEGVVRSFY